MAKGLNQAIYLHFVVLIYNLIMRENPDFEAKIKAHAETLSRDGIGDAGMMFRQMMFGAIMQNPSLADSYQQEADKFFNVVENVCPPALIAGHIREVCEGDFVPSGFTPTIVADCFEKMIIATNTSQRGMTLSERRQSLGGFYFTPEELLDFVQFSRVHPEVMASMLYTSSIMKDFVLRVIDAVENTAVKEPLERLGKHFGATNLITRVPIALQQALFTMQGEESTPAQIDEAVVIEAMRRMNEGGQFQIKGRLMSATGSKDYTFDCPVQGYLSKLFIGEGALLPIIQRTVQISESPESYHVEHVQNLANISLTATLCAMGLGRA